MTFAEAAIEALVSRPFPEQIAAIDRLLDEPERRPMLLQTLAQLPDHEPLAHAVRGLITRGFEAADTAALMALLMDLPDTGLQRLLREQGPHPVLIRCVVNALMQWKIDRLHGLCLLDRWLKNVDPAARIELDAFAVAACSQALGSHDVAALSDEQLLRLSGVQLESFGRRAEQQACGSAWRRRLSRFSQQVLGILQSTPRSLSQANAEELLSRRVYTDPGHFLIELLQNAEDAGARTFRVDVSPRDVTLWHDGAAFDARDVVGVLSIGQTTKAREQIGFFGVGFKSVYEICERPQVHSTVFSFEIADVSIPRPLDARPPGAPREGTLIVLPYREGAPEGLAANLFERARAIPAQTLLTLESIERLEFSYEGRRHTLRKRVESDGRVTLERVERGIRERYLLASERCQFDGPREVMRVRETTVMVAVALDEEGAPVALPEGSPTIFSHLPTGERLGLRFMVHAHFDVPVDRERLDLTSAWNRWALARAGGLLARLVARLVEEHAQAPDATRAARLDAALDVLPVMETRSGARGSALAGLVGALREGLRGLELLPMASGERRAVEDAYVLADTHWLEVLARVPLDANGREAVAALPPRRRAVVEALGVEVFGADALLALLQRAFAETSPGDDWPAPWLKQQRRAVLSLLGRDAELFPLEALRALPLIPDQRGAPRRADELVRADDTLREMYGELRLFVDAAIDHRSSAEEAALLRRLQVASHGPEGVLADLLTPRLGAALVSRAAVGLFEYLARWPVERLRGLEKEAIFPDEEGLLRPLVGPEAVWCCAPSLVALSEALRGRLPPLLDPRLAGHAPLLIALGARRLDLDALLEGIEGGRWALGSEGLDAVLDHLDEQLAEMNRRQLERVARAPLFPTSGGSRAPLLGEGRALIASDAAIVVIAPDAPWLAPEAAQRPLIAALPVSSIGPAVVIEALLWLNDTLPIDPFEPTTLRAVYRYLIERTEEITPRHAELLSEAPIWFDASGGLRALSELRRAPEDPALAELYARWPRAASIEERGGGSALALARALRLDSALLSPTHLTLLRDLGQDADAGSALGSLTMRPLFIVALRRAVEVLPSAHLVALRDAHIFTDRAGLRGAIGSWSGLAVDTRIRRASAVFAEVLERGGYRLLSERDEVELEPLLSALGVASATPATLIGAMTHNPNLRDAASRLATRRALTSLDDAALEGLDAAARRQLSSLPMWPTEDGNLRAAESLLRPAELNALLGPEVSAALMEGVTERLLGDAAEAAAERLAAYLTFDSPTAVIIESLEGRATVGATLSKQPAFMNRPGRLVALLRALSAAGVPVERLLTLPLSLDVGGQVVTGARLWASDSERLLCRGLGLDAQLGHPEWAPGAHEVNPEFAPRLLARRLLEALLEQSRDNDAANAHPSLSDASWRATLYAWLLERGEEIEEDRQARGLLGKCCVLVTEEGALRSPHELLHITDAALLDHIPSLRAWTPGAALTAPLIAWLARLYRAEDRQLDRLITALVQAHRDARTAQDADLAARCYHALARGLEHAALGLEAFDARVRKHKLHRVRVGVEDGGYERPRKVLMIDDAGWALMVAFCVDPPPRLSSRYRGEPIEAVLRSAGIARGLDERALVGMLERGEGLKPGAEAARALACYIARELETRPSLYQALSLERAAWIPDTEGARRAPEALYWPGVEVDALVGEHGPRPHSEFFHIAPESLASKLPFLTVEQARPEHVLAHLDDSDRASPEQLAWLERASRERRIDPEQVRARFAQRALLVADDATACRSGALICHDVSEWLGHRRRVWSEGRRLSKLSSVLGIHTTMRRALIEEVAVELVEEMNAEGDSAPLERDPLLCDAWPRVLAWLARADEGALDVVMPVVVCDALGGLSLARIGEEGIFLLPSDAELPHVPGDRRRWCVLPDDGAAAAAAWLRARGVPHHHLAEMTERAADDEEEDDEDATKKRRGIWGRVRRWWQDDRDAEPPRLEQPRGIANALERDHGRWFRSRDHVDSQLAAAEGWLHDRNSSPDFGFAFSPGSLPLPYRYAPHTIVSRFEAASQRWSRGPLERAWSEPDEDAGRVVLMRGRVPSGEVVLPLPLFGRLVEAEARGSRLLTTRAGQPALMMREPMEATLKIALGVAPSFTEEIASASPTLFASLVPEDELPDEALDVVDALKARSPLERALGLRDFVRERYRYDPSYLEDAAVAAWLQRVSQGRPNLHLAALHAGRDARHLGAGVCYELNTLVCELLRRAGVPAALATGWTLDRGDLDEPDHMWCMALLSTSHGPRWLPVDASTTREGRPLRVPRRPPGPWRPPAGATPAPAPPSWSPPELPRFAPQGGGGGGSARGEGRAARRRRARQSDDRPPLDELVRVARYLSARGEGSDMDASPGDQTLRERCATALEDPAMRARLLELLR